MFGSKQTIVIFFIVCYVAADDSCPTSCKCDSGTKTVNCKGNNLQSIPSKFPSYTEKIILSMNAITEVGDKAFAGAPKVKYIDLRHNFISKLGGQAFSGIPLLETLYLIQNKLDDTADFTSINLLTSLSKLYISFNLFTKIPALQLVSLRKLVMDGNKLGSATFPADFKHCSSLQSIVLSHNSIGALASTDFLNLPPSVKSLDLKLNYMTEIDPAAFGHVSDNLETLDLNDNKLTTDSVTAAMNGFKASSSPALLVLSLSRNKIDKISSTMFSPLQNGKLRNLQLDENIFTLDAKAFSPVASTLELLSLRKCGLSALTFDFNTFPSLQNLALDGNHLTTLPTTLPSTITRLSASRNKIASWSSTTFTGLHSLNYLDLSANELHVVDNAALNTSLGSILASIRQMNFKQNPFNCTCDLKNFIELVKAQSTKFVDYKKYYCITPTSLSGKEIIEFNTTGCKTLFKSNKYLLMAILRKLSSDRQISIIFKSSDTSVRNMLFMGIILLMVLFCIFVVSKLHRKRKTNKVCMRQNQPLLPANVDYNFKIPLN